MVEVEAPCNKHVRILKCQIDTVGRPLKSHDFPFLIARTFFFFVSLEQVLVVDILFQEEEEENHNIRKQDVSAMSKTFFN